MPNRVIKYKDKEFIASDYQEAIFKHVEHGVGNMIIRAAAGSAKTTTIVNCIFIIPKDKKTLFVAFNKDIVESINNLIGKKKGTNVSTFHSLGFSIFKENQENGAEIIVNEFKYKTYIRTHIRELLVFTDSFGEKENIHINVISQLVDYSRYYMAFTEKQIQEIAEKYGIQATPEDIQACRKVMRWGKTVLNEIDYTDMIWLTNVLNYGTRKHRYDWILIDEAQDTTIAEQELITKCCKRGCRIVATGDQSQTINTWCGSDIAAINRFAKDHASQTFTLPISYRCPKSVVALASRFSDNIIAADDAIEGEVKYDVSKYLPNEGDMVLCRTTAPLFTLYMDYLRANKKATFVGQDSIRDYYISLIKSCKSEIIDRHVLADNGLVYELYTILGEHVRQVINTYGITLDDACQILSVVNLSDAIDGICAIAEGITYKQELIDKINVILGSSEKKGVILSTVHKSKGLEADNVYILHPELMPISYAKKDWEILSEKNLIYVSITRAKKTLNYIKPEKKMDGDTLSDRIKAKLIRIGFEDTSLIPPDKTETTQSTVKITDVVGRKNIDKRKAASKFASMLN